MLLHTYPGLASYDCDLVRDSTDREGKRCIKVKSPSGAVLDSVAQIIVPCLVGLVSEERLSGLVSMLICSELAQQPNLNANKYVLHLNKWMETFAEAGGKFNVRVVVSLLLTHCCPQKPKLSDAKYVPKFVRYIGPLAYE